MSAAKIDGAIDAPQQSHHNTAEKLDGEEYVRWAYRLLLGREPENIAVVQNNPFKNDRQNLVRAVLNSAEFHTKNKGFLPVDTPYSHYFDKNTIAFVQLPKTGGTTLRNLLTQCFSQKNICPQLFNALHSYSPAQLAKYDFFAGHFDYFSLRFIPRQRVRCLSLFREPCQRLISAYRYGRAHPPSGEFADDLGIKLANELTAEEFFEHEYVISSTWTNNAYLFFFGSSLEDRVTLEALVKAHPASGASPADDPAALELARR